MKELNTISILNTKLQKPNLPDDYIYRPYLIDFLNKDIKRPLTLVSAGAGFGKSTLVSDWLDNLSYKKCWFSIDEQDNDLRNFLSYFIASVQNVIPSFGRNIYRNIFSPNIGSLNILTNNLINDLSDLQEDAFLVLDDFQNINNLEITNLISNILKYPPEKFHLIIISRTDPPLPLHKLRVANKMKDIRSAHLRFTNEEVKNFLQNNPNLKEDRDIISGLNDKFEGWVAGIRLLKIHLSYADNNVNQLEKFIQNTNLSETYFIEELIKHVDDNTLHFLLQTSVFQKFTSSLSDYVLSTRNKSFSSKNIIKELLTKNLFLINLDNQNQWFRYHHLFQDVLQKELKKTYTEQDISKIHKKATSWFLENSFYEEAFYHIIQLNDVSETANFIRTNLYMPLNINKWFVLEKWLKHIPDRIINECPVLLTAQMWILHHKGVYWIIPELINKIEEIKNNNIESYDSIKHQLVFFKATINFWNGNIRKSLEQFDYVKKKMAFDKLGALSLSSIYFAIASQMLGDGTIIYKKIQFEIGRDNLPPDYKIILLGALVYIKFLEGDLYTAERIAKRIAELSKSLKNEFYRAWYEFFMGYITFQQYRTEEAVSHFKNALKLVYLLNTHGPVDAFAGALLTLKQTNRNKEFEQIFNELTSFVYEWNNPTYNTITYSLKTRLSIIDNDLRKAAVEFKKTDMFFDVKTLTFNIEVPRITYCRLLLAENSIQKTNKAIDELTKIYDFVTQTHNIPQTIDVLVLLSVAYYKTNSLSKAIDSLTQALILAEKGHIIYPFVEQSETVNVILPEIKTNDENINEFISLLTETISNKNKIISVDSLSNRELDIINLLAQRLSNKEIADKLFISTSTVKRHTINIYQKLGVNKRREAVEMAQKNGVIHTTT